MDEWLTKYLDEFSRVVSIIPRNQVADFANELRKALIEERRIFVIGNGGSASNASHFVTDLGKGASLAVGKSFKCASLCDNISWITALANDESFDEVYVEQLKNFAKKGDLLLSISVSGNSPNIVKAVEWANDNGLLTLTLAGGARGQIVELSDQAIVIDSEHYGRVEDAQMVICHMICYAFMENPNYCRIAS
jgi:D-sedoheptulose 7-phosphate isomerase